MWAERCEIEFEKDATTHTGATVYRSRSYGCEAKGKCIRSTLSKPTDVAVVQRLLGITQYLAKFLQRVSDMTKPLHELTAKDVDCQWDEPHQTAVVRRCT